MAKKKSYKREKREKVDQIDHIPKHTQQPRSRAPKRRTDFSLFFSSSSSPSSSSLSIAPLHPDTLLESSSGRDIISSITTASLASRKDKGKEVHKLPLVRCGKSKHKSQGSLSNFIEVPIIEVESLAQNTLSEHCNEGNINKQKSDAFGTLEFTPEKSQVTESNDVCVTPGSVVWAKTACQLWWPAEIMGERSTLADSSNQGINGHVLVQYYGNHKSAWVDPARDLSQFEDCFEERSCNTMEDFQDALKQALHQKEHLSSSRQLIGSPGGPNCSNQLDQSPDKWNSSSSSGTEGDYLERGRGKRKRKPKVHFDEVTFPLKSARKVRRFRIMRYLGLAAPIGSPFSLTPHVRIAS